MSANIYPIFSLVVYLTTVLWNWKKKPYCRWQSSSSKCYWIYVPVSVSWIPLRFVYAVTINIHTQDFWRICYSCKVLHGVVLRIQFTSGYQWQWRLNFMFTPGNVDDWELLRQGKFLVTIKGKLCADKGYVKNNMRNSLISIVDKILFRERVLIEIVNDKLKNIAQIGHSRHRSFCNFIANSLSVIAAYCFFEKKPAIDICFIKGDPLVMFWAILNLR